MPDKAVTTLKTLDVASHCIFSVFDSSRRHASKFTFRYELTKYRQLPIPIYTYYNIKVAYIYPLTDTGPLAL